MVKNIVPLERKVLEILWIKQEASARDICHELEKNGNRRAYSTVRTIINRLVKKNIVSQKINDDTKNYMYTPILTRNALEKKIVHKMFGEMLQRFEQSTISYLSEELSDTEEDVEKIKKKLEELKHND
jgi:predicted transcriptional regulator